MKLAISNIAWTPEGEQTARDLVTEFCFRGVEIAPTRVWNKPLETTREEARAYRRGWEERAIEVVALQALLFGRPELTLFETRAARIQTLDHLKGLMRLAEWLGAGVLVFGAPKNRRVGVRSQAEAWAIAGEFFADAGTLAQEHGVVLAIEPNPRAYDCDFITTSVEGLELVQTVARVGFGLHLDSAALSLAEESPKEAISSCARSIRHFHISEPFLGPIGKGAVDHEIVAATLRQIGYAHWVSVEMRPDTPSTLREVLAFVARTYGD